jgi:hypothetical protein
MNDNFIQNLGDNLEIKDKTLLRPGVLYYFIDRNNKIFKGNFSSIQHSHLNNTEEVRYIFNNVEICVDNKFKHYTDKLSTPFIIKIYYL